MDQLVENSTNLQEKVNTSLASIVRIKIDCEQFLDQMKLVDEWLKLTEQQLNRCSPMNLNSAEEKSDASKKLLVSLKKKSLPLIKWKIISSIRQKINFIQIGQ